MLGIVVGAAVGFVIGAIIASARWGGRYRHVGGGWFQVLKPGGSDLPGCLLEIVMALVGAGVGFLLGGRLLGS
jgi:hypothetical protein